ncbi:MAG: aminotransferase DegT [Legionellaceae bacterium]|nr:aminotransferase DegT [Legionellaceae bacterium]HAF86980.1 aminotransferase DegT [Legionellales bacterium]HCA88798.1 aminotransferase DegT [Legionellales bacterium]|tara:strand:- start:6156 stop:7271 length:1116 start_codon:yes stop_codon:yes gene_type:complete
MQFIDLKKQYSLIDKAVLTSIENVLQHGQYIMGPEITELEKQLADFVGVRHAIACASGTDALLMALLALDIEPGDEIITTPFSFFATAEVIALCQAKPVFVDIQPETYNLDPSQLVSAITDRTKAIMPVSLYGQCADITAINHIANRFDIPVIEDAAQSFGATHFGHRSCGLSTLACTSFFPSKPLGGYGDSGACFTDDDTLAQKLSHIRIHGQNQRYCHQRIGINGRMDTIQAAILLQKLALFPAEIKLRHEIGERYYHALKDVVKLPLIKPENTSVFAQFTIEVKQRDLLAQALHDLGIPTAIHYPTPLHLQEALSYLGYQRGSFPCAELASAQVISLPMSPYLTPDDQDKVIQAVKHNLARLKLTDYV